MSYEASQLCRFGRRLLLLQQQCHCRALQHAQRQQQQQRSSSSASPVTAASSNHTDEMDRKRLTLPIAPPQRLELEHPSTQGPSSSPEKSVHSRAMERQRTLNALRRERQTRKQELAMGDADTIDTYERDGISPEAGRFLAREFGVNWTVS